MEGGYVGAEPSRAVSTCTQRACIGDSGREGKEGWRDGGRDGGKGGMEDGGMRWGGMEGGGEGWRDAVGRDGGMVILNHKGQCNTALLEDKCLTSLATTTPSVPLLSLRALQT